MNRRPQILKHQQQRMQHHAKSSNGRALGERFVSDCRNSDGLDNYLQRFA
ncbi:MULTISPECIES: hypothetical protein [Pseudomonas]|nr:hypothetical protein [Pseudomonas sp. CF150]MBJ2234582.1 hypothetical protein [Pseudomonas fluorescens]NKI46780.1 hypothetical protein [Pseudomonas fluorescens]NKI52014.1 hypothetical protein [Pseudomonas fluorescens]NKI62885.1 hypothetical protein [Pseudomonas fluorescens]